MKMPFELLHNLSPISSFGPSEPVIESISYNSAEVTEGSAFFCIAGENTDGHRYIEESMAKGAKVIIGSDEGQLKAYAAAYPAVTFIAVADPREAMAQVASWFYGNVQEQLIKIGVTGTNGKTTVAKFVQSLLNLAEVPCGFLGTLGISSSKEKLALRKNTPTTPLSPDIHRIFSELKKEGDRAASMEVTSIALDQKRVAGILFDVAIHTNISEEHMEYHKTFDHYLTSKLAFFKQAKTAVVNLDDAVMAGRIIEEADDLSILTYSGKRGSGADLIWTNCKSLTDGLIFDLLYNGQVTSVKVPIYGEHNAGNLTAAIGAGLLAGISFERILQVLPQMGQVEGRFQVIDGPESRKIILDYAHTPVAIDTILTAVRKLPHNRLIALVAGIGIRSFSKMPKMAEAAEGKADVIVVTVDHPGNYEPADIINEVLKGFTVPYKQDVVTAFSRKEAVIEALRQSGPGDIVLLTSGCINGAQIVKGKRIPHSDEEIIEGFFLPQR